MLLLIGYLYDIFLNKKTMMKVTIYFALNSLLLFSCNGEQSSENAQQQKETTTVEDLPEGKWNGEYMKITDSLAEENMPKKKSKGASYFNMGSVKVNIDTMEFSIDLFDQKRNHISLSKDGMIIRIKSAQRDFISIQLKKPNIMGNYSGNYPVDHELNLPIASAVTFSQITVDNKQEYTLMSGTTIVEHFSTKRGKLVLEAQGKFEDSKGNVASGSIKIDMVIESIVSAYNPNS
jgi:hypothetical protein